MKTVIGMILSAGVLFTYLQTLSPTVSFIDSGELAAVSASLGIAHPTGYPLFTILGWFFTNIPFADSIIYRLNIMSATLCAIGVYFFFILLVSILEFLINISKINSQHKISRLYYVMIPALAGTLILAFSPTYWSQANAIEVYSLHVLFLSLTLLVFFSTVKYSFLLKKNIQQVKINFRMLMVFSFILGLSFTNHMTTILMIPALVYLFFTMYGFSKDVWRILLVIVIIFLIGLSVYLYLPVRAVSSPQLNWGNPVDIEKIFWHVSGKQYRVWIFSSTESAIKQLNYFVSKLPKEFGYFSLIVALIGMFALLVKNKVLTIFTLLLFISCIGYSINYDIHDIDSYFLLAYFIIAIWVTVGIQYVVMKVKLESIKVLIIPIAIGLGVYPIVKNYSDLDESENYLVEDYTKNIFESIEPNGIILSYQWDYFVSASYYYQIVEKYRPDVTIIDKELLRRSWYFNQLETNYPEIIQRSRKEIDDFLIELYKFEHNLPWRYEVIEGKFRRLIRSFIDNNIDERAIYVTTEIESEYLDGYIRVPNGLCQRLYRVGEKPESKYIHFNYRPIQKNNKYVDNILDLYLKATISNAIFNINIKNYQIAKNYIENGIKFNPNSKELKNLNERFKTIDFD